MVFFMISRGIEINEFTYIRLTSEVKFGDDPSNHYPTQRRIQNQRNIEDGIFANAIKGYIR